MSVGTDICPQNQWTRNIFCELYVATLDQLSHDTEATDRHAHVWCHNIAYIGPLRLVVALERLGYRDISSRGKGNIQLITYGDAADIKCHPHEFYTKKQFNAKLRTYLDISIQCCTVITLVFG